MNIFNLESDVNHFECFRPFSAAEDRKMQRLNGGKKLVKSWGTLKVKRERSQGPASDFPDIFSLGITFSERALKILSPLCSDAIEPLPVDAGVKSNYFAINVLAVIDALDHRKSEFSYYSSGKIMSVDKYVFKKLPLRGKHIFRLPETDAFEIFVSEDFKKLVEENGLKGALFTPRGH